MQLVDRNICFACGKDNPQGMRLPMVADENGARVEYLIPVHFQGWSGITHGGIVATLLDELMAWSVRSRGYSTVTAEMSVRFRKPVRVGERVYGQGWVVSEQGRLIHTAAKLSNQDRVVFAEATGKLWRVDSSLPRTGGECHDSDGQR